MDHNIVHMNIRNWWSKLWDYGERAIQIIMKILQKNREDNSDPYLAMLALPTTQNSSDKSVLEFLMKRCCEHYYLR